MSWTVRVLEEGAELDRRRAENFVADCDSGHYFQYPSWMDVAGIGSELARLVIAERQGEIGLTALLTFARVGGVGPWLAHVIRGPVTADPEALEATLPVLLEEAKRRRATSLRLAPYAPNANIAIAEVLNRAGFKTAVTSFDYDRTLEADLSPDEAAILRSYRKGHRKDVLRAQLAGVHVVDGGEAEAEVFDKFYREMADRKGAPARPKGFFQRLERFCRPAPHRRLFLMSRLEDRYLAGLFVMVHGRRAIGAFGASPVLEPSLPRTHILHYEAMIRCKALGCGVYDLGGFSSGIGVGGQRTARHYNNVFKSGFARREVDVVPEHEFILRPVHHALVEAGRRLVLDQA